eukprot:Gb_08605 [translate_table: standard]
MDGLDSRGQVVLIGATNRIDAINGALRRPGRGCYWAFHKRYPQVYTTDDQFLIDMDSMEVEKQYSFGSYVYSKLRYSIGKATGSMDCPKGILFVADCSLHLVEMVGKDQVLVVGTGSSASCAIMPNGEVEKGCVVVAGAFENRVALFPVSIVAGNNIVEKRILYPREPIIQVVEAEAGISRY